jgi:ATP-dependent Clp protease ATP-binding subunit ClpA
MNLSQDLQIALTVAVTEAARRGHEYAVLEHLLLALTLSEEAATVLRHTGADLARVRRRLERYLTEDLEPLPGEASFGVLEPRLSLAVQRSLARAGAQVEGAGKSEIRGADLLVALFAEPDSFATQVLEAEGVTRLDVVSFLAHGVSRLRPSLPPAGDTPALAAAAAGGRVREPEDDPEADPEDAPTTADEALRAYTQDLTALAQAGALDPLVGRRRELSRALHVLQRRRKNNPLFVGDPGVGKTALAEGLAVEIARGEVPAPFRGARLFRLDLGALLAGTRYRGDFEDRLKGVLAGLEAIASGERPAVPILFIDEIHTLVGAGSAGRGTLDASNLLKPALQAGTLRVLGATTWDECRHTFERDTALARRFQKIEVVEPSAEETARIFAGLQERYEHHHRVRYGRRAVTVAVELSARYLRDRRLPDAALDVLDEAGAAVALARGAGARVGRADVEGVVASMARVPRVAVAGQERDRLQGLEASLKGRIFGQDEALERLVAAIQTSRAGLREGDRPVGCFLLTGPTGVGKTETAKELARTLGVRFLRFDMSEYMERHTVSRLVGAPPGYVGYDRGGLLTEAVAQSPHAVLLLDEVEKAHEDVFNLLLQVMDHGTLTDTNGKAADFRHVILLMTSNVGAAELAQRMPGFLEGTGGADGRGERAVERRFAPEFRNRLDAVLRFQPLSPELMERIVDKLLGELETQLAPKRVTLQVSPEARALLAREGHDPALGARPLGRVLDQRVKRPLAHEILFGALTHGGTARVAVAGGEVVVEAEGTVG